MTTLTRGKRRERDKKGLPDSVYRIYVLLCDCEKDIERFRRIINRAGFKDNTLFLNTISKNSVRRLAWRVPARLCVDYLMRAAYNAATEAIRQDGRTTHNRVTPGGQGWRRLQGMIEKLELRAAGQLKKKPRNYNITRVIP